MIKRPLVWAGIAYILGEILGVSFLRMKTGEFIFLLICIISAFIPMIKDILKDRGKYKPLLFIMSFLFVFGTVRICSDLALEDTEIAIEEAESGKLSIEKEYQVLKTEEKAKLYIVYLDDKTIAYIDKELFSANIRPGAVVRLNGNLSLFEKATNKGQFDMREHYRSQGYIYRLDVNEIHVERVSPSLFESLFAGLRSRISDIIYKNLSDESAAVLNAMITGDRSFISEDVENAFNKVGAGHILVISGLHISMIGMAFYELLLKFKCHRYMCLTASSILVLIYGAFTGMTVSVIRSTIMFFYASVSKYIGKTADMATGAVLSACLILNYKPVFILNTSFIMSFACIFAIAFVYPGLSRAIDTFNSSQRHKWVLSALKAPLTITLVLLPVNACLNFEVPLLSVPVNLIAVFMAPFILGFGIICILLSMFHLPSFFLIEDILIKALVNICKWVSRFRFSSVVTGHPGVILMTIIISMIIFASVMAFKGRWKFMFIYFLIPFMVILPFNRLFIKGSGLHFLDVGQGDCSVIITENNKCIVIDGGSSNRSSTGKYIIKPFLKYYGIDKIDLCVFTHMDNDHINGLMELVDSDIQIEKIWVSDWYRDKEDLGELAKNDVLEYVGKDKEIYIDDIHIKCLWPDRKISITNDNNASIVLMLDSKAEKALFCGDIDSSVERILVKDNLLEDIDVLKIPHHGSGRSSCEEFLKALTPEYAVISCGMHNRYGHPEKTVLDRLKNENIKVYDTRFYGEIDLPLYK